MSDIKNVTKQALSKARRKLNPIVFELLNKKLVSEFYTDNEFKTFKNFRVLAIDGSTIQLPSSPELISFYGCCSNRFGSALPMAQASVLFDTLNKITINSVISPYKASKKDQALELLKNLLVNDEFIEFWFSNDYPLKIKFKGDWFLLAPRIVTD